MTTEIEKLKKLVDSEKADGWFFHASEMPISEKGDYVVMMVFANNYTESSYYGDYWNFFKPSSITKADKISSSVIDDLLKDFEDGNLRPSLDDLVESAIDGYGDDVKEELAEQMNPKDIVSSGELWEDPNFVEWFFENYDYSFIQTTDGGLTLMSLFKGKIIETDEEDFES